MTPCPNPTCAVRTRCRETATINRITYRRRYCPSCHTTFLTRELYYRPDPRAKNPFTVAHAMRSRKEPINV